MIKVTIKPENGSKPIVKSFHTPQESIAFINSYAGNKEAAQHSAERTDGTYCPKGHLLFSDGTCPRCECVFPISR